MSDMPNKIESNVGPISQPPPPPPESDETQNQPDLKKKIQNVSELMMEIEEVLQEKVKSGKISKQQFEQLSEELNFIQGQYQKSQANEYDAKEKVLKALSQLQNEIQTAATGKGETATGEETGTPPSA